MMNNRRYETGKDALAARVVGGNATQVSTNTGQRKERLLHESAIVLGRVWAATLLLRCEGATGTDPCVST
jgi:hypothetical protein